MALKKAIHQSLRMIRILQPGNWGNHGKDGRIQISVQYVCRLPQTFTASQDAHIHVFVVYLTVLQPGLISKANGSAYIETERTKIACAVSVSFSTTTLDFGI